ncbi:MAG: hypothetical protein P8170_00905, partial [Gemmatimonadota bacterium]
EADSTLTSGSGALIQPGEKTIENEFFFTNGVLRAVIAHELERFGLQAGLEVRSYDYQLEQRNHVDVSFREQDEAWMEWSPTLGAVVRFSDVDLRYAGRLTTGTGRPGVALTPQAVALRAEMADFIVAPQAPLTLQDARVVTHQVSVRIPIR